MTQAVMVAMRVALLAQALPQANGSVAGVKPEAARDPDGRRVNSELPRGRRLTIQDGKIVAGRFRDELRIGATVLHSAGETDVFVAKLSAHGQAVWAKRFGDVKEQAAGALAACADGDLVVAGTFHGNIDFGGGPLPKITAGANQVKVFIAKLGPKGEHRWSHLVGLEARRITLRLTVSPDGSITLTRLPGGHGDDEGLSGEQTLPVTYTAGGKRKKPLGSPFMVFCPSLCTPDTVVTGYNQDRCPQRYHDCAALIPQVSAQLGQPCLGKMSAECIKALMAANPTCASWCSCTPRDICVVGDPFGSDPSDCQPARDVVAFDPYCGTTQWDAICVSEVISIGGKACPCPHLVHEADVPMRPGCNDCVTTVDSPDPYCGSTWWDGICVSEADKLCATPKPKPP